MFESKVVRYGAGPVTKLISKFRMAGHPGIGVIGHRELFDRARSNMKIAV